MKTKLSRIYIIISVIILILISLGIYKSTAMIISRDEQVSQLKARNDMLVITYVENQKEIKALKFKTTGLNQEIEALNIDNSAYKLFADDIKSRYINIYAYAEAAQLILKANGITFMFTELPIGEGD